MLKLKSTLTAVALAALLAGPAAADDNDWRHRRHDRGDHRRDHGRDHDRDHGRRDWRHDDRGDWRANWHHHSDGHWRRDDRRDHWRWRHVPPAHYRLDFGYRSGYDLAWRDWDRYGRHDRYWRRWPRSYGYGAGYWAGYDAGWRDAAYYFEFGYRPGHWAYDPRDGWYFGFRISG